jgi:hypothetical protein
MKRLVMALMLLSTVVFAGCVTVQQPVHLDQSYWSHKPASLGVVIVKMPKPGTLKMGNQGLLDMGINGMMADSLTKHLNSISMDDFREAGQVIADHFSKRGVPAKFIPEELDISTLPKVKKPENGFASLDYSALKAKYGVEQLVVLQVNAAGTIRNYYGFIPTGAPQGYFSCSGSLMDLSNNKLLWTAGAVQQVPIEDPWDQASESYPHVTTAFYRALETAKTTMVKDLVGSDTPQLTSKP